jgi:AraC family transcriptional regulator of arabinose operon
MSRVDDYCPPASPISCGAFEGGVLPCWRARGLRDYLIMYITSGACRIGWAGGDEVVSSGEVALIAPGVPHDYGPTVQAGSWGVLWAVFAARPAWLEFLHWPGPRPGIGHLVIADPQLRERICHALEQAGQLAGAGIANRHLLAMNALEAALLWCTQAAGRRHVDPRLSTVVAYICEHLHRPLRLATLARVAGVSRPQLSRIFRQRLGTTPQRFLEDRRLARASELLRATAMPVQEVAAACGFGTAFYFSTRFSRRFGRPPRVWRQQGDLGRS